MGKGRVRGAPSPHEAVFFKKPEFSFTTQRMVSRRRPVCRKPTRSVQPFRYNTGAWRSRQHRIVTCTALRICT